MREPAFSVPKHCGEKMAHTYFAKGKRYQSNRSFYKQWLRRVYYCHRCGELVDLRKLNDGKIHVMRIENNPI